MLKWYFRTCYLLPEPAPSWVSLRCLSPVQPLRIEDGLFASSLYVRRKLKVHLWVRARLIFIVYDICLGGESNY